MKYLLTCLALGLAFAAGAQTGLVEFPYNPDADNDDVIGTADLLALLSLYGSEFSEEGIYLSSDSTTALYYAGSFNYAMCLHQCSNLSGDWWIPTRKQFCRVIHPSESSVTGIAWLDESHGNRYSLNWNQETIIEVGYPNDSQLDWATSESNGVRCFCYTHERPKVEYSYCRDSDEGGDPTPFAICAQEKAQDGWYPLGGMSSFPFNGVDYNSQAFWRWAE